MIPPTLAAFRALMAEAAEIIAAHTDCDDMPECPSCVETKATVVDPLRALATATPEQLLGIAFVIRDEYQQDTAAGPVSGYYVTPREDA